jgi:hypothetical protein
MLGRKESAPPELAGAFSAFVATVQSVEGAKATLLAAVPGGRRSGAPLAEALAGFEEGLDAASSLMAGWREEGVLPEWEGCASALRESAVRAEHLRLVATPEGYEQLYGTLGDLIEPLEAFAVALSRFRELGLH